MGWVGGSGYYGGQQDEDRMVEDEMKGVRLWHGVGIRRSGMKR